MSLWTKPLSEVVFDDVQAFCDQKIPEGVRIDYKECWSPKARELGKDIAAFANTHGGLLLIGVREDPSTNTPEKIVGVAGNASASERVIQTGLSLGPGVCPSVSDPIPLAEDPSRSVYVIRVDQSPLAPHVTGDKDRVYLRTGDVNNWVRRADIGEIESLIKAREGYSTTRRRLVESAINRFDLVIGNQKLGWSRSHACVLPMFPIGPIATVDDCYRANINNSNRQRVASGAVFLRWTSYGQQRSVSSFRSVTTMGDLVDIRTRIGEISTFEVLPVLKLARQLRATLLGAKAFLSGINSRPVGSLQVIYGFEGCRGAKGADVQGYVADHAIFDQSFQFVSQIDCEELLGMEEDSKVLTDCEHEIMTGVCSALDLPARAADAYFTHRRIS